MQSRGARADQHVCTGASIKTRPKIPPENSEPCNDIKPVVLSASRTFCCHGRMCITPLHKTDAGLLGWQVVGFKPQDEVVIIIVRSLIPGW